MFVKNRQQKNARAIFNQYKNRECLILDMTERNPYYQIVGNQADQNERRKMSPIDYATKLEQTLFEKQQKPFTSKTAKIYLDEFDKLKLIHEEADIYDLLESNKVTTQLDQSDLAVLVVTTGWASPLTKNTEDNEMPPSQHPERRRVRLSIYANRLGEVASILRFEDEPNKIITDEGTATGSLADAISQLMRSK